jgi:hypothetical protein
MPVNISPLSIIYGYATLFSYGTKCCTNAVAMMTNIENNGAPWQYNQQDRLNWKNEN